MTYRVPRFVTLELGVRVDGAANLTVAGRGRRVSRLAPHTAGDNLLFSTVLEFGRDGRVQPLFADFSLVASHSPRRLRRLVTLLSSAPDNALPPWSQRLCPLVGSVFPVGYIAIGIWPDLYRNLVSIAVFVSTFSLALDRFVLHLN